jgi:hypothetical protein
LSAAARRSLARWQLMVRAARGLAQSTQPSSAVTAD